MQTLYFGNPTRGARSFIYAANGLTATFFLGGITSPFVVPFLDSVPPRLQNDQRFVPLNSVMITVVSYVALIYYLIEGVGSGLLGLGIYVVAILVYCGLPIAVTIMFILGLKSTSTKSVKHKLIFAFVLPIIGPLLVLITPKSWCPLSKTLV